MENLRVSSKVGLFSVCPTAGFRLLHFFPVLRGSSDVRYFGDSYLEFAAVELAAVNDITVSFQTAAARGTLLYVDQGPANAHFFMKLFLVNGLLQVETETLVRARSSLSFTDANCVSHSRVAVFLLL